MADHPETAPRLQVTLFRKDDRWWWEVKGRQTRMLAAQGRVRIETAVANLEDVLGVQTRWIKPARGWRTLTITNRPIDVEIRR